MINREYTLSYDRKILSPESGEILGNGDLSVSVYQTKSRVVFRLGKGDFWDRRQDVRDDPIDPPTIAEFKRIIEEGWRGHLDGFLPPEGVEIDPAWKARVEEIFSFVNSYDYRPFPMPKPLCELAVCFPEHIIDFDVKHVQYVEQGRLELVCRVIPNNWTVTLECFIDSEQNVMIVSWRGRGFSKGEHRCAGREYNPHSHGRGVGWPIRIKLQRWPDPHSRVFARNYDTEYDVGYRCEGIVTHMSYENAQPLPVPEVRHIQDMPYIDQITHGDPTFPSGFRVCTGLLASETDRVDFVTQEAYDQWARVYFNPATLEHGWVIIPVASSSDNERPDRVLRDMYHQVTADPKAYLDYSRNRTAQSAKAFWQRSRVDIDEPALQRTWISSLNILRAIYKPGTVPPGLFVPSTIPDYSYWHGDYHTNYNIQQPFWGVLTANHPELVESYMDACDFFVPMGRQMARELFDIDGLFIQLSGFPIPEQKDPMPSLPLGRMVYMTAWASQLHWWHYKYTGDKEMLQRRGYPFIRECAKFFLGYLEKWDDGYYHSYPSHSGEKGFCGSREKHLDSTQELGALRFLLRGAIDASKALDVDESLRNQWQERLDHLPPYPVSTLGKIIEFQCKSLTWLGEPLPDPALKGFRDGAEFLPFPAEEVTFETDNDTWECISNACFPEAYQGSFDMGSYERSFMDLPPKLIWYTMSELRLGRFKEFEGFCNVVKRWLRPNGAYESFPTAIHGHGPQGLQTEGLGIIAPIQEMLLQSWDGILRIFPYWPDGKAAKFKRLRAHGAFLVSASKSKEGTIGPIEIHSEKGGKVRLLMPWKAAQAQCDGQSISLVSDARGLAAWSTEPGQTWFVQRDE